jgi:hypothetical protein
MIPDEGRCSDPVCHACDLKRNLEMLNQIRGRSFPLVDGHFYWVLVEIDTDGRIDHQENFEILPGCVSLIEGQEPEWTVLRSRTMSGLNYHSWSVFPIAKLDHKEPLWDGDGVLFALKDRLDTLFGKDP